MLKLSRKIGQRLVIGTDPKTEIIFLRFKRTLPGNAKGNYFLIGVKYKPSVIKPSMTFHQSRHVFNEEVGYWLDIFKMGPDDKLILGPPGIEIYTWRYRHGRLDITVNAPEGIIVDRKEVWDLRQTSKMYREG